MWCISYSRVSSAERARELLNGVLQCNQSYGIAKYVHFLRGTGGQGILVEFFFLQNNFFENSYDLSFVGWMFF